MMAGAARDRRAPTARKRKVILIGYPRFAQPLESLLSDAAWECRFAGDGAAMRLPFVDALYQVGGGHLVPPRLLAICRIFGRPIVKHWVGTDAESAAHYEVQAQHRTGAIAHWADSPWIADELRAAGLESRIVTLNHVPDAVPAPMPSSPLRVLVYLPEEANGTYDAPMMARLARRFPNARFLVVGGCALPQDAPPNMELLGFRDDMAAVYADVHVLVRMPRRDGMSFMVTEALSHGRYVVWNRPMTGAVLADDEEEAAAALAALSLRLAGGSLPLNEAGMTFARAEFGAAASADRLHAALESVLAAGEPRR